MTQRGTGFLSRGRIFLTIGLVVLLVGMTTFPAGAAPVAQTFDQTLQESREVAPAEVADTPELDSAVEGENQVPQVETSPDEMVATTELESGVAEQATETSGADLILQSLNQLNAAMAPLSATEDKCNNADFGTGAYAETLCWIDFSGFTTAYENKGDWWWPDWQSVLGDQYTVANSRSGNWGDIKNYPVSVDLGGGYILTALLDVKGKNANGKQLGADFFPTYDKAFLGNHNFYTGVDGNPALYQLGQGGQSTLTLKSIELKKDGILLKDYSVVVADAESTDSGESIIWSTTGAGFKWLPNNPSGGSKEKVMGNACSTINQPWNSNTPFVSATCSGGPNVDKTGTAMLATEPPVAGTFSITQELYGRGLQGVAFGVIVARAEIETKVSDRIVNASNEKSDSTNFLGSITSDNGTSIAAAETGTIALSSTSASALPVSTAGTQLLFTSSASGTLASSYVPAWQCIKTDPSKTTSDYWPSQTTTSPVPPASNSAFTKLSVGQYLKCTVEYTPPYLTLVKKVDNGETAAKHTAADFTLNATRNADPVSKIWGAGNGATEVTKRAVAVGQYALGETSPDPAVEGNWKYGYDWTDLVCKPPEGSIASTDFDVTKAQDGTISGANLTIKTGSNITCTYTNVAREPQLEAEKAVYDATGILLPWDKAIDAGSTVSYKLTFRNSGTAAMELDYRDYLGDVLDDSTFVTDSIRISDGQETAYPAAMANPGISVADKTGDANPQLVITGDVQRAQTRTVWFKVTVLSNQDNATARQAGKAKSADDAPKQVGYTLSNYLVPAGKPVLEACPKPGTNELATCTQNPVPAWSVSKDSRPASGARLHKGGNAHYQITATKMNAATSIEGLVFEDDLTHVFKTAGWAPGAAVPGGALKRGIYFFDANGQSLDKDGNAIGTVAVPAAAFDENSGYVPEPTYDVTSERWTLKSLPVTVPANAMRAEMWFAVQAGERPANIPSSWVGESNPVFGSKFVNYVRAQAQTSLAPNQCSLVDLKVPNTGLSPTSTNPQDEEFPDECRVMHQMSDNYFTIRKDARGAGIQFPTVTNGWGDSTGLTNMVGHEFEIRDDVNGVASTYPSVKLCRAEYNPETWDGTFIPGGTPDWGQDSKTLAAIIAHNNKLPEGDPGILPLCGLFYPQGTYGGQPNAGGQDGRWRSEYLSAGDYWLVETKAPDKQINNSGTDRRSVPGVQLLSQPVGFKVWPDADGPTFGAENPQQSMEGRGQVDVKGLEQQRCSPGAPVAQRPVACVNATGYLMLVQDVVPISLPLSGGTGGSWLLIAGGCIITAVLIGLWLWRRNQVQHVQHSKGGENPM